MGTPLWALWVRGLASNPFFLFISPFKWPLIESADESRTLFSSCCCEPTLSHWRAIVIHKLFGGMIWVTVCLVMLAPTAASVVGGEKKGDLKDRILGTWTWSNVSGDLETAISWTFARDGKVMMSMLGKKKGKVLPLQTGDIRGTYKILSDKEIEVAFPLHTTKKMVSAQGDDLQIWGEKDANAFKQFVYKKTMAGADTIQEPKTDPPVKIIASRIIGSWRLKPTPPADQEMIYDFNKDGKFTMAFDIAGKPRKVE